MGLLPAFWQGIAHADKGKDSASVFGVAGIGRTGETPVRENNKVLAGSVAVVFSTGRAAGDDFFTSLFGLFEAVQVQAHSVI